MIRKGRGIAFINHPTGTKGCGDPDQASIKIKGDGTLDLILGVVDYGQGAKTVMRQIAADALDVPVENIAVHNRGTDVVPMSTSTGGSRVTFTTGNAVIKACKDFKKSVLGFAAGKLSIPEEELSLDGTDIYHGKEVVMNYQQVGAMSNMGGEFVMGKAGYYFCPAQPTDPDTGESNYAAAMGYAGCVADVSVDTETGYVTIDKLTEVFEAGTIINPLLAEGQAYGGTGFAVGMALMEDLYPNFPETTMTADNFTDYIIPTTMDMPDVELGFVEMADENGPFGAKGLGEMTGSPQPPAIINAIYDAVGVRIDKLPATPEKILRALSK